MIERVYVEDLAAFERTAHRFAQTLQPGDVVTLTGPLGAGKTTFVRAIVCALHGADEATSPTFTFRHTYPGAPPIEHLDLYRIEEPAEALELGLHEAFDGESLVVIEWPERLPHLMPVRRVAVAIRGAGAGPRELEIERFT